MTENDDEKDDQANPFAGHLGNVLIAQVSDELLTPHQLALKYDTLGLLLGIQTGEIQTGQPRIRDNMVELCKSLDTKTMESLGERFRNALYQILVDGTSSGFTVEGANIGNIHSEWVQKTLGR